MCFVNEKCHLDIKGIKRWSNTFIYGKIRSFQTTPSQIICMHAKKRFSEKVKYSTIDNLHNQTTLVTFICMKMLGPRKRGKDKYNFLEFIQDFSEYFFKTYYIKSQKHEK